MCSLSLGYEEFPVVYKQKEFMFMICDLLDPKELWQFAAGKKNAYFILINVEGSTFFFQVPINRMKVESSGQLFLDSLRTYRLSIE